MQKKWISHRCTELLAASILSALVMTKNTNLSHFAWHLGLCFLQSLFYPEQGTACNHCFGFSPASCPKPRLKGGIKGFICMGTKAISVRGSWRSENTLLWKTIKYLCYLTEYCELWEGSWSAKHYGFLQNSFLLHFVFFHI